MERREIRITQKGTKVNVLGCVLRMVCLLHVVMQQERFLMFHNVISRVAESPTLMEPLIHSTDPC